MSAPAPALARTWRRHWPALAAAAFALAALTPLARPRHVEAPQVMRSVEWPTEWQGEPLRPLASSDVERRFAARFPGSIARFAAGDRVVVLRDVQRPTRMLHPAADCFRGLGHRIAATRLERDAQGRLWRCFEATPKDGAPLRVCERIEANDGRAFVDASAWFWSALSGESKGPWRAVTVVEAIR